MAYTHRAARAALKPFSGLPFHGIAERELAFADAGAELRARTRRIRAAFLEYQADLDYCGELQQ